MKQTFHTASDGRYFKVPKDHARGSGVIISKNVSYSASGARKVRQIFNTKPPQRAAVIPALTRSSTVDVYSHLKKLDGMKTMEDDWNGYGTEAPSDLAIEAARSFILDIGVAGFAPSRVTPSAEGGVAVCFSKREKYADIEVFNNGDTLALVRLVERPEVWDVDRSNRTETLKRIREYLHS